MEKIAKHQSVYRRLKGINAYGGIEMEGDRYQFGEDVSEYPNKIEDLDDLVKYYPLGLLYLKEKGYDISNVCVSLPAGTYNDEMQMKKHGTKGTLIDRLTDRIMSIAGSQNVKIVPQGVMALYRVANLVEAEGIRLLEKPTLVIDGGFNTLSSIVVAPSGEGLKSVYTKTYYDQFGVRDLLREYFLPELRRKYPEASVNEQRLNRVFIDERINDGLGQKTVTNEKNIAIQGFLQEMFKAVLKDIEKAFVQYDAIVFVGGISHYLDRGFFETERPIFLPKKDGEFLTVLGMCEAYPDMLAVDGGFGHFKVALKTS